MSSTPSSYWNYGELGPRFGFSELDPPTPAQLAVRQAELRAFRAMPRGRFLAALERLAELPCPRGLPAAAAAAARSAYSRGFSAGTRPSPAELACARRELQLLADHPGAAEALAALSEIEAESAPIPAAAS